MDVTQFLNEAMIGSVIRWLMGTLGSSGFVVALQLDAGVWPALTAGAVALGSLVWSIMNKRKTAAKMQAALLMMPPSYVAPELKK